MSHGDAVDLAQALGQAAAWSAPAYLDPTALLQFFQHIAQIVGRWAPAAKERMNAHRAAAATEATQDPEGGNRHARAWRAVVTCIHAGSIDRSGRAGIGKAVCDALNQGRGNPRLAQRMRYLRHSGPQRSWSQTRCDRSAGGSRARQATGSTVAAGAMVIGSVKQLPARRWGVRAGKPRRHTNGRSVGKTPHSFLVTDTRSEQVPGHWRFYEPPPLTPAAQVPGHRRWPMHLWRGARRLCQA